MTVRACVFLLPVILACSCSPSRNSGGEVPPVVGAGLETYRTNGLSSAYKVWANRGPLESDTSARDNFVIGLEKVQTVYGKVMGYEIVKVVKVSSSVRRVYAVVQYEKAPVYASFDCYRPGDKWYVTDLLFHTKVNMVFPPSLLDGR